IPAQRSTVLGGCLGAVAPMWTDEPDTSLGQGPSQLVAVIGAVSDHALGLYGTAADGAVGEGHLIGPCAEGPYGDRKTMSVCDGHDLGAFTSLSRSNITPPFLALAKVPSRKHSVMSIFPRSRRSTAKRDSALSQTPALHHCWKYRWHVWYEGYRPGRSFHGAPVRHT